MHVDKATRILPHIRTCICVHTDILYLSNEPWLAEKQQHKKKQVDVIQSDPLSIMCFDQYQTC